MPTSHNERKNTFPLELHHHAPMHHYLGINTHEIIFMINDINIFRFGSLSILWYNPPWLLEMCRGYVLYYSEQSIAVLPIFMHAPKRQFNRLRATNPSVRSIPVTSQNNINTIYLIQCGVISAVKAAQQRRRFNRIWIFELTAQADSLPTVPRCTLIDRNCMAV